MKKSIIIYADCIAILEDLTYEQAGRLFKAILSYVNDEPVTEIEDDPAVKIAYKVLKTQIDRDTVKYEEICKKRSEYGKRHKGNQYTRLDELKQKLEQMEQKFQIGTVSENVNVSGSDSGNKLPIGNIDKENPTIVGEKEDAAAKAATPSTVKSIEERQKAFYDTLRPYVNKYPKEMLRAFYDWWSEPNRRRTKLRVELEKTWDLPRRLATWNRKDEERKFNNTNNGNNNQRNNGAEQRASEVASIIARLAAEDDSRK